MFQKRIIEKYSAKLNKTIIDEKYDLFRSIFANPEKQENIRNSKEEQYQEGFLRDLFVSVLGYTINPEPNYNLLTEQKNISKGNDNRKADGAVIFDNKVKVVIELKGTDTTDLNKIESQAFLYKEHNPECKYVVISNFERLRFYVENAIEFEEFNLFNLSRNDFNLLYLCLEINQIKNDIPLQLKHETVSQEKEITDSFYGDYSVFKRNLFEDIYTNNPDFDKLLLFKKTQKLLDRILFILFCEDRGLLPENSIMGIINDWKSLKKLGYPQPLYNLFKTFFERINTGFKNEDDHSRDIFAYNGGLFKADEILDNIKIGDDVLFLYSNRLSDYDFESQISVDILGHIFEHSLTEIEEVQKQIEAEKSGLIAEKTDIGKRKKDGVFYTPSYITKYIVENTIGKLCNEKKEELGIKDSAFSKSKKTSKEKDELNKKLEDYKQWLLSLKILDPACGSGAFLNAALKQLKIEHTLIDYYRAKIYGDTMIFQDVENDILEKNIFGVDINEESVEIAKLSLWLHTAQKNRKLTTLNNNIKCGNSLIDNPEVAGEKAFNWQNEFPEVFEKGGFDIVIGNPPYGAKIEKNQIDYISSRFEDCGISTSLNDTYFCFYALGLKNLIMEKGILGFISPNTWKLIDSAKTFRNYLLNNFTILEIVQHLNKVFEDATVDCDTLIIQKKGDTKNIKITFLDKDKTKLSHSILQSELAKQEYINLFLTEGDYKLKRKIIHNSYLVKDELVIKNGVKPYEKGKGKPAQTAETLKTKPFTNEIKMDDSFSPLIGGSSFNKYKLLWKNDYWIKYGEWLAAPREKEIFEANEKLIFRQTSDRLIGTYITSGFIMRNNTHILLKKEMSNLNLKYILSLLNSKLLDWYYWTINPEHGEALAEVKAFHLGLLPIKKIDTEQQKPFIELAEKMLNLNTDLQKLSSKFIGRLKESLGVEKITSTLEEFFNYDFETLVKELSKQKIKLSLKQKDEWEDYFTDYKNEIAGINQQIETTDKEINSLVYKLYELTPEEIQTIENAE